MWKIEYTDIAERAILKLDRQVRLRIEKFFRELVAPAMEPRVLAEPLTGELRGLYRFRVGDYRVICDISDGRLVVLVLQVGHRKEIYRANVPRGEETK